jgi:hypothetical protein
MKYDGALVNIISSLLFIYLLVRMYVNAYIILLLDV